MYTRNKILSTNLIPVWIFTMIATTLSIGEIEIIIRIIAYTFVAGFTGYNWWLRIKEKKGTKK